MKQWLYFPLLLFIFPCAAQPAKSSHDAIALLKKIENALQVSPVSYQYTMEMRYYADNYHYLSHAGMYLEYDEKSAAGLRFQASNENGMLIYDGSAALSLDNTAMTIDTSYLSKIQKMDNNIFLYHSFAMLRNILPLAIHTDSVRKAAADTLIDGRHFLCVTMDLTGLYFGAFRGIERAASPGVRCLYYLIVDDKHYLPYQFIEKHPGKADDRDFIAMTYTGINSSPAPPDTRSWSYAYYSDRYHPYIPPPKIPIVKAGTVLPDFSLPRYAPGGTDSVSLHQYAGKAVLLEFWFKSCGPCMAAMPHYSELQEKFGKAGFQLLTVNIEDSLEDLEFFYNKFRPGYPMLYKGQSLFGRLGFTGCPSSVLADKNGRVIQTFTGFSQEKIERAIGEAVKE